jgi:hypothetical protein
VASADRAGCRLSPRQARTDQRDRADRIEPTEPNDRIDRTEPAEPIDKTEPAEPMDKIDPAEPIDKIEPVEPMDRIEPVEPIDSIEPGAPIDWIELAEPVDWMDDRTVLRIRAFSQPRTRRPPGRHRNRGGQVGSSSIALVIRIRFADGGSGRLTIRTGLRRAWR